MPLWRCANDKCRDRRAFESDAQLCPTCKMPYCHRLVAVHYLVAAGSDGPIMTGLGPRMVACDPNLAVLPQSTGERSAVSCPKCIASDIFIEDERDGTDNHVPVIERANNVTQ